MRFYIFSLLIALAMARKHGGINTGPPNNGAKTVPPNNGAGNTVRPNNGGNNGPPNNGGNNGSSNNGPPKGEPFSCLSFADKEAGNTCMGQEKKSLRFLGANVNSNDTSSCTPKCILQQLKAIDSSNQVNTEALVAVLNRANLTDSQKISATDILKTCLAASATDGSTDANGSRTPTPNQNKGTTGVAGGKNQNGGHNRDQFGQFDGDENTGVESESGESNDSTTTAPNPTKGTTVQGGKNHKGKKQHGKGHKGKNAKSKGSQTVHNGDQFGQFDGDENTGVESESGESNDSTTTAPNPTKRTTVQGGKNHKGKKQNGKGLKGKNAKSKGSQTVHNGDQFGQYEDNENTEVESGESNESSTPSQSSSTAPKQSNWGGKNQSGKGPKKGNQNGQGPSGGRDPPPNITPECQASAKGVDCLGKALSANDCGPPQGPNGHSQKGRQ